MQLRDYQQTAVDAIRQAYRDGRRAPLLVSPCGSGKTITFAFIAHHAAARGNRVTILVHRQELLDQVSRALTQFDMPHGMIAADHEPAARHPVQVASVMSLIRRLPRTQAPDLLVIDEAHHATAGSWGKIVTAYPKARLLGVTATPCRMGGGGLGDVFDTLVMGPTVRHLTDAGHLSPARVFAPPTVSTAGMHTLMGEYLKSEVAAAVDKPTVTGDAIDHYQRLTPGRKAVVFCVSLEHAAHIAEGARKAGITAVMIDGGMDRDIRRRIVRDFAAGHIQWLVSVDLIQEGFDCPDIEVGIFLRPTQSLGLWLQQTGRVLRTAPGKTEAVCLDHAGNTGRHGLPDEDREWTLEGGSGAKGGAARPVSTRICPQCWAASLGARGRCPHCGTPFPVEARQVKQAKGDLKEITAEDVARRRERQKVGIAKALPDDEARAQLADIARIRGYKPGWIDIQMGLRHRGPPGHRGTKS